MRRPHWTKYLPNIGVAIELPFLRIYSSILYERQDSATVEWTALNIRLWKWHFDIRLYKRLLN